MADQGDGAGGAVEEIDVGGEGRPALSGQQVFALLWKTTQRPSALIEGEDDGALAVAVGEPLAWLTRVTVPVWRSRRKTSSPLFASTCPAARFGELLRKAT